MVLDWSRTIEGILEHEATVRARCDRCGMAKLLDREALLRIAAVKGPGYSLFNRRTRCKLSEGCQGWVSFALVWGMLPRFLWDEETAMRWMRMERLSPGL